MSPQNWTCSLARIDQSYRCDCKITEDECLSQVDKYVISLCTGSDCHQLTNNFIPSLNSKLDLIKIVVSVSCLLLFKKEKKEIKLKVK